MNTSLYQKRRLRSNAPILTMEQIRAIGKMIGLSCYRDALDRLNQCRSKLIKIHQYLLNHGITRKKQPSRHWRVNEHACLLVQILYPGYPLAKAKEQAYREERESNKQNRKTDLAYDLIPWSDMFERLEEILKVSVQKQDNKYHVSIDRKVLEPFARQFQLKRTASGQEIRLHAYLWKSRHLCTPAHCKSLIIHDNEVWCSEDKMAVDDGYRHVDLSDKIDWTALEEKVDISFTLEEEQGGLVQWLSLCTIWFKSAKELAAQLYLQSVATLVSRAIYTSCDKSKAQQTAVELLEKYTIKERIHTDRMEELFVSSIHHFPFIPRDDEMIDDKADEILMQDESVSLSDPIMLARIIHPARGIHCRHTGCFDALYFFQYHRYQRVWQCPLCSLPIRGIQELYIDTLMKRALQAYPAETHLVLQDGDYVPGSKLLDRNIQRPLEPIELRRPSLVDSLRS